MLLASIAGFGQKHVGPDLVKPATYWIKSKNFYLLTLLEQDKTTGAVLKTDPELSDLSRQKLNDLKESVTTCKDAACFPTALQFTSAQIGLVSNRLKTLCTPGSPLSQLVNKTLIPSGKYSLYKALAPADLLVKAWEQDASAINYTIEVYAKGKKPNYPQIDSIAYNVKAKNYSILMYDCSVTLLGDLTDKGLFFEPALQAALTYLDINERKDPANYEPMADKINKAAFDNIKFIKWAKYPYTNILVPGAGPDNLTSSLSGEGMLRCRLAARQFRLGIAPLIMVSGGNVHPYKTKYNEAEQMKIYLVQELNIPESAIITEPHARHTTTNMRNCARLIYEYGIPANKPGLVITDKSQTDFITTMDGRCVKELGYVPYKLARRISDTGLEYYPLPEAKQIDPDEPLDPQ